jgi:hypothetical protein
VRMTNKRLEDGGQVRFYRGYKKRAGSFA